MLQQNVTMPAIPAIAIAIPSARDSYLVCDMPGFIAAAESVQYRPAGSDWTGGMGYAESLECCRSGNPGVVTQSDSFMGELESMVFVTRQFRVIDSVVGAVPNVPAFLAGVPENMRLRRRTVSAAAPLSIFADISSSAAISGADITRRGVAILALVRLLSNLRPVELFVLTGLNVGDAGASWVTVRVDTSPLDLARAGHLISHASVSRGLFYGVSHKFHGSGGSHPYSREGLDRKHGAEILSRVTMPGNDTLFIPYVNKRDENIRNPVAWLKDMLARYGGNVVQSDSD